MARLLRRSAAAAAGSWQSILLPRLLPASTSARQIISLRRHHPSAPTPAPASTGSFCRWYTGDEGSRYEYNPPNAPVNKGIIFVPEGQAFVVERFGKYIKTLYAGINGLIPFVDRIAYVHSLKEQKIEVTSQKAFTLDHVCLDIDGFFLVKIIDPYLASYSVDNPFFALEQLARATVAIEIEKITMDKTFLSKEMLNNKIMMAIDDVAAGWGIKVLRYEIGNIFPSTEVMQAMELEAISKMEKKAQVILSQGARYMAFHFPEADPRKFTAPGLLDCAGPQARSEDSSGYGERRVRYAKVGRDGCKPSP